MTWIGYLVLDKSLIISVFTMLDHLSLITSILEMRMLVEEMSILTEGRPVPNVRRGRNIFLDCLFQMTVEWNINSQKKILYSVTKQRKYYILILNNLCQHLMMVRRSSYTLCLPETSYSYRKISHLPSMQIVI